MMFLRPSSIQERIADRIFRAARYHARARIAPPILCACDARPQYGLKAPKARCHKDIGPFFVGLTSTRRGGNEQRNGSVAETV